MNRPPEIIVFYWLETIAIEEDAEILEPLWLEAA